jgi:hypothetical protein
MRLREIAVVGAACLISTTAAGGVSVDRLGVRRAPPDSVTAAVTLADIGFRTGLRFSNLGGRREVFISLPEGGDVAANELVLVLDDVSAYASKRSLEVLVNDRSALALPLDGRGEGRVVHVPLTGTKAENGFLKLDFVYSGAATRDRCIDERYVGDSLTVRPESELDVDVGTATGLDVATTVALMPRDITIALPSRRLDPSDIASALVVARALAASGRRTNFLRGYAALPELELDKSGDPRLWTHGLVIIGSPSEAGGVIDDPIMALARFQAVSSTVAAVRINGMPALLVSDAGGMRAGAFLTSPNLAATRSAPIAFVGPTAPPRLPTDRIDFDELGVAPAQADVFGRAELDVAIDARRLPADMRATRLLLDVMIAPDGADNKAVISAYVNERLLGSTVAASDGATRLDLPLPDGLVGNIANVRTVVQRLSVQGDCRYEPQGYPVQILGSSAFVLAAAVGEPRDFSDLAARWAGGVQVLVPAAAVERPELVIDIASKALNALLPDTAPIDVKVVGPNAAPAPSGPFLAVSELAPTDAKTRVRFDRGRVAVSDSAGRTVLDLAGLSTGAVAQIITARGEPGLWLRPLAADGALPAPTELRLDHGDVAFLDQSGVALAMSSERDTLVHVAYLDETSWSTVAARFRFWIIGGLWLFVTAGFLFALQRILRRRPTAPGEE